MLSRASHFTHIQAAAFPTSLARRYAYRFAAHTTSRQTKNFTTTSWKSESHSQEDLPGFIPQGEPSTSTLPKTQKGSVRERNISKFAQRLPGPEDANLAYRFREFEVPLLMRSVFMRLSLIVLVARRPRLRRYRRCTRTRSYTCRSSCRSWRTWRVEKNQFA